MKRPKIQIGRLSAAAFAAIAIGGLAVPAASPATAHRIRHVTYEAVLQPTGGTAPCDPTMPTRCAGTFENVFTYSDEISGTSYAVGAAALAPDGIYRGVAIEQFSGTIAGCGTGTVTIQQTGTLDPATGEGTGSWTIVPGAGSGDLAATTGGSTGVGTAWIRCR
jgi:hypothetical protein